MNIKYQIDKDASSLTLTADDAARAEIRELVEEMGGVGNGTENEVLETLSANSELQWLESSDTGDLTDAPFLGITGEETTEEGGPYSSIPYGVWNGVRHFRPILERWGYMQYETRSFLEDLMETGKAVFVNRN